MQGGASSALSGGGDASRRGGGSDQAGGWATPGTCALPLLHPLPSAPSPPRQPPEPRPFKSQPKTAQRLPAACGAGSREQGAPLPQRARRPRPWGSRCESARAGDALRAAARPAGGTWAACAMRVIAAAVRARNSLFGGGSGAAAAAAARFATTRRRHLPSPCRRPRRSSASWRAAAAAASGRRCRPTRRRSCTMQTRTRAARRPSGGWRSTERR